MQLKQQSIIGTGAFDDVGRPVGIYWNADRTLLAVAGAFAGDQWHGRDVRHGRTLRWRVSLYEAAPLRRIAVLDRLRWPINDIAFHPHHPLLAIGAGSYDGGYFYEGELVLWDWQASESASLLTAWREVVTCRFDAEGEALHLTLRPPIDEDELDPEYGADPPPADGTPLGSRSGQYLLIDVAVPASAWRSLQARSLDVEQLPRTIVPTPTPEAQYRQQSREQAQAALIEIAAAGQRYTARWDLWDVVWMLDNRILATRNATAVECWTPGDALIRHLPAAMDGV